MPTPHLIINPLNQLSRQDPERLPVFSECCRCINAQGSSRHTALPTSFAAPREDNSFEGWDLSTQLPCTWLTGLASANLSNRIPQLCPVVFIQLPGIYVHVLTKARSQESEWREVCQFLSPQGCFTIKFSFRLKVPLALDWVLYKSISHSNFQKLPFLLSQGAERKDTSYFPTTPFACHTQFPRSSLGPLLLQNKGSQGPIWLPDHVLVESLFERSS